VEEFFAAHPLESDLERERALAILGRVGAHAGGACPGCGATLLGQEVVESVVLGHQDAPLCRSCLAREHGEEPAEFRTRLGEYIERVPCFRAAWTWCGARGAAAGAGVPGRAAAEGGTGVEPTPAFDAEWDAGDTGCGDLVLELRARLRALEPGQVLRLRATDPGAPADIPAWCGLTGNPLRRAAPPHYWIARRGP